MAQIITVRLSRSDGSPWGFRLQGGKDFGTPLLIQKVNGGSPAEKAGLIAGDSVIKVNSTDVFNLRHKDAQDVIVRAGQTFEFTIQRGGSTWKPAVIPTGNLPKPHPVSNSISPVTKTSLAAKKQDFTPIGTSHNVAAKGFNSTPHLNGNSESPKLVNKQYNTPMGLYSEASIAETLSAQAEVLSTGALGVNFKKNEKNYNSEKSEVFKMLQEAENEPHSEPVHQALACVAPENQGSGVVSAPAATHPHLQQGMAGLRHVTAPETKPAAPAPQLPPGQNICADCERLIVGVFVRIKDKNLHVECFKCATCGTSLKNVGYYNINHKLYCDIHAKLAAKSNPPGPNMVPVTVPPGSKAPLGTISAALASHSLPSPSPMSPTGNQFAAPFQHKKSNSVDTFDSPVSNPPAKKDEAVLTLMSALSLAKVKQTKDSSTNTNGTYLSEAIIPINNNNYQSDDFNYNVNNDLYATVNKSMKYPSKTGASLTGPKPFSSVGPSTPTIAPVSAPMSNTLPRVSNHSAPMPEHVIEDITNNRFGDKNQDVEVLMSAVSSEMYIPVSDYKNSPKFNSIDLRIPVHVVKENVSSPDQEVFQINASRSYENSPIEFDGSLRNSVIKQLENTHFKQPPVSIQEVARSEMPVKDNSHYFASATDTKPSKYANHSDNSMNDANPIQSSITSLGLVDGVHPVCIECQKEIKRGPFITALGKIWCPEHFICTTPSCRRPLQDMGFVEENGQLYCEYCFEQYLAPPCSKCNSKIKGDCLNAIGKHFHPECFTCAYCGKLFGNSPFFLEDGLPYCEADWNELFTTKCFACGFPVEAGDRWVEALNNNYHSQCFNCTMCKKNLEGQSFYAKGGRPFCKNHAR